MTHNTDEWATDRLMAEAADALTAALDEIERLRDAYTGAMEDKHKWKGRCAKAESELRAMKGTDQ